MQLRTQIRHKCHPKSPFLTGGPIMWPLCSCPVQVGSSVTVKWQDCKFCLTAEAPLRETKWRQPVVVTHCCWQGDDEHLSLKGRSWAFPWREHVLVLMSKGEDRGWNRRPWGPNSIWFYVPRTSVCHDDANSEIHRKSCFPCWTGVLWKWFESCHKLSTPQMLQ